MDGHPSPEPPPPTPATLGIVSVGDGDRSLGRMLSLKGAPLAGTSEDLGEEFAVAVGEDDENDEAPRV